MKSCVRLCHLLVALLSAGAAAAAGAADLVLYFEERPPLMSRQDGHLTGLQGAPATAALQRAGLTAELRDAPVARQVAMIARNLEPACALGLYRTPERQGLGRYSRLPVYASPPQALLIRKDGRLKDVQRFAAVVQSRDVTLALRLGYSYGAATDKVLAEGGARLLRSSDHSTARARLVLLGMADAALFTPEEGEAVIGQLGEAGTALALRHLPDVPAGEGRYFFCSHAVPERVMRALDAALAAAH